MKGLYTSLAIVTTAGVIFAGTAPTPAPVVPVASVVPVTAADVVGEHELAMRWSCENSIKQQLRNPRSYEASAVRYLQGDNGLVSTVIQYRAENGFGGKGAGTAVCGHDTAGRLVKAAYLHDGV